MIQLLSRYRTPKLFYECYSEIDLSTGKYFNEKTIGQLVGKSGERKEEFFSLTGVKPHIEYISNRPILILSKYSTREIKLATLLGHKFRESKSWSSTSIHKYFNRLNAQFEDEEEKIGQEILKKIHPEMTSPEIFRLVGRMSNERYSNTQTLLEHSIEVGDESYDAASSLSLSPEKARRISFYHDIGKIRLPYYLHNTERVFTSLPALDILEDEIKEGVLSHHKPLSSFTSPYLSLLGIVNRILGQSHFLSRYSHSEKLKEELARSLKMLEDPVRSYYFHILYSGYHFWVLLNSPREQDNKENNREDSPIDWEDWIHLLEHNLQSTFSTYSPEILSEIHQSLNITLFWLPSPDKPSILKKLNLKISLPENTKL